MVVVFVTQSGGAGDAHAAHEQVANLRRVGDALDESAMCAGADLRLLRLAAAATGRLDDDVSDAEVALQRTLVDRDVLDVLVGDGRLVDDPDAAADAKAATGEDIPGGVVLEMDGRVASEREEYTAGDDQRSEQHADHRHGE